MKQETGRLKEILHVLNQHQVTHGIDPEKLCNILEDLGPTYVKLGQIMSMRSDILPERYCKELAKKSNGDMRSAINTFQALANQNEVLELSDIENITTKDDRSTIINGVTAVLKRPHIKEEGFL